MSDPEDEAADPAVEDLGGEADPGGQSEIGFGEAMEQLETILSRIEGDATDIDALALELRRAARLLELCRQKIRKAEAEIELVVEKLD